MSKKRDAVMSNFEGFEFGNEGNPTEFIPTGHAELDYIIASGLLNTEANDLVEQGIKTGGLPTGKLVMFYGEPGGGKSSLAYSCCAAAQQLNKIPIWIDVENSFSESLAKINGVDLKRLGRKGMYDKNDPDKVFDGEYALDAVMEACRKGAGVVVLDSVASLVPKYVMENASEKETMALLARLLGRTVNKICSLAAANNTLVIFINQLRVNPGAMFKNPEGYPGGNAIGHACSIILQINKKGGKDAYTYIEDDDGNERMIAGSANIFVRKNRFAAPHFGGITIPIYYENYFPQIEETIFNTGRQTKTISVRSGVFSWGKLKVEGKKAFIAELIAKNKVGELVADIKKDAEEDSKIVLPGAILNYEKHVAFAEKNKAKLEKGKQAATKKQTKEEEVMEVLNDGAKDESTEDLAEACSDNPEL